MSPCITSCLTYLAGPALRQTPISPVRKRHSRIELESDVVFIALTQNGSGFKTLEWVVNTYDTDYLASPVYFFWLNPGPNGLSSAYFNITDIASTTTSSSPVTSTTTTSTSTSTSNSASTTTTSDLQTSTALGASNMTNTNAGNTPPSSNSSLPVGLGVGLGVGIPLLLAIGIWLGILAVKSRRGRSVSGAAQGAAPGSDLAQKDPINHSSYDYPRSSKYTYPHQQSGPHEVYAGPMIYEAPGREPFGDKSGYKSPVELG